MVRIKSILAKYKASEPSETLPETLRAAESGSEKDLQLLLARANDVIAAACEEIAPHRLCQYIYEVSNSFNKFYHETKIIGEEDREKQNGWIALLSATLAVLADCIGLLGFDAPEKM